MVDDVLKLKESGGGGWEILLKKTGHKGDTSVNFNNYLGQSAFKTMDESVAGGRNSIGEADGFYESFFTMKNITKLALIDGSAGNLDDPTQNTNYIIYDLVESSGNESMYEILNRLDTYALNNAIQNNDAIFGDSKVTDFTAGTNGYSGLYSARSSATAFGTSTFPDKICVWGINRDSDNDTQIFATYWGNLQTGKGDNWRGATPSQTLWSLWGNDWHSSSASQTISKQTTSFPGFNSQVSSQSAGSVYLIAYSDDGSGGGGSGTAVNADWDATSGSALILNKPTLFSGSYHDLTNQLIFDPNDFNIQNDILSGTSISINSSGQTSAVWNYSGTNIYYLGGNVGINTTSIDEKLHINGGNSIITNGNNDGYSYNGGYCIGDSGWRYGVVSNGSTYYNEISGWWGGFGNNRGFRIKDNANGAYRFYINGNGESYFQTNVWSGSYGDFKPRFYYSPYSTTYFRGHGNPHNITFRNGGDTTTMESYYSGGLWILGGYGSSSDSRIKKNITDIEDKEALNKLLLLEPKKYEYIDPNRGDRPVIGFIAQQVKEVLPEAVSIVKKILPNVMQNCNCDKNKIFINLNDIKIGNEINIKYNDDNGNETGKVFKVKEITTEYILLDDEDGIKTIPENLTECFVYGYEVEDYHILTKEYIWAINVSATQELHKIIMEQKEEINLLKEILARNGIL